MKALKNFFATFTLMLVLSSFAYAGQIDTPPVAGPPPPPTPLMYDNSNEVTAANSDTSEAAVDPYMEITLNLIQTLLSIF